ncbi:cell division protein FtsA [Peribacillus alkalitolerans]|uniref:cell division protein FtsA n=1 Tax=Peribacillus alkalitolerans TaxID=1550385 RepID=UPI001F0852D5|nr:cell division protein FtsA [Peribacillus alkalitolerans]
MHENLFALDIGTRSVVGIILEKMNESYHVKDILSKEHTERAMLDGQIHDVLAVSKVIQDIKNELESKHGPLNKVCVAAAGRALKTERAKISVDIAGKPMISKDDILHLELTAVQAAQSEVAEKGLGELSFHYYCVGYSVLYYHLDGQEIGSLIDQKGEKASVEIIATFLPKVVVESLIAALKRADLEMQALTLEPIAAINVLIPPSMRRLNVALVDIGAGTSDIALTDMGTVIAYGMVPVAGDEITEAISDQLLLDFPLAEEAKRQLLSQDHIKVTDILGFETEISRTEVVDQISPALHKLAESISQEVLSLNNHKSPKAIMLVGGGSLTPELPRLLAEKLQLPANRVAIRGIEAIQNLTFEEFLTKGPELVTPIGIAIAANKNPVQYVSITVNDQNVRLFDMKTLTVGDCLLAAGIKMNKLYGKPGMAIMVSVNGQTITIPGIHGTPPTLLKNGEVTSLDDEVRSGDVIIAEKGEDGYPATVQIQDLLDHIPRKIVTINGTKYELEAVIKKNGQYASGEDEIQDRDTILCKLPDTIEALLDALGQKSLLGNISTYSVYINDKPVTIDKYSGTLVRNGIECKGSSGFEDGDELIFNNPYTPTLLELSESLNIKLHYSIPISYNGKKIVLTKSAASVEKSGKKVEEKQTIHSGDRLTVKQKKIEPFIFQDLFRHIDIEMPQTANARFLLLKNNKETSFYEQIEPGDDLRILWPTTIPGSYN